MVADARSAAAEHGMVALREHREHAADREGAEPMDQDGMSVRSVTEAAVPEADVSVLSGHTGEVFCASWNPTMRNTLATGYEETGVTC